METGKDAGRKEGTGRIMLQSPTGDAAAGEWLHLICTEG